MAEKTPADPRITALGLIIKLTDDVFKAPDFDTAASLTVNSSHSLLRFKSAVLVEVGSDRKQVIAQYGQTELYPHSELAVLQKKLAAALDFSKGPALLLSRETLAQMEGPGADSLGELLEGDDPILALKMEPPAFIGDPGFYFVWLLEFSGAVPDYAKNAAGVLARNFGHALFARRCCGMSAKFRRTRWGKWLFRLALLAALIAVMFVPVRERLNAEFVLKAPEIVTVYAWFDGPVARVFKQDGDPVKKGTPVMRYDLNLLNFKLANAKNQLAETEKEYDLESRAAFNDRNRLGRVKLLEARLQTAAVAVREAQWYIDHAEVKSPADGLLVLAGGRAEQLENKAVRTGDKLFEVYGGQGVIAEIQVNERESSILAGKLEATLFPYTSPETGWRTEILSVRKTPELTEQRLYCYVVKARVLNLSRASMRYGMRGIARLEGERVALWYYLFRSLFVYMRWF